MDDIDNKNNSVENTSSPWTETVRDAAIGEEHERKMSLWEGLKTYPKAVMWSMAISFCLVMEGYDTLLLGNLTALPQFRAKYGSPVGKGAYQLNPAWQSAIGYAPVIGAVIGILVFSSFQTRYGYRKTIQLNLILISAFIFVIFFAPNIYVLFVGELLAGIPWGCFSTSAVSYASEVTPMSLRAYLTVFVSLCWLIGQFFGAGVIYATHNWTTDLAFKLPFALQWMWPVPLFILVTLAPESPWYLVRQNRIEEAEKSLKRLSSGVSDTEIKQSVALMIRTNQTELELTEGTSYLDCFRGVDLRRTEIVCMMWATQQLTGSAFANHPAYYLEQAGFSTTNALQLDLGLRGIAFCATLSSWVILTFFGRRRIILTGELILATSLLLIGCFSIPGDTQKPFAWAEAAMIFVWVVTWDSTIVACYSIVGEASSTRLRGKSVGLARIAYNCVGIPAGIINTYSQNPTAWNWKGRAAFFWLGSCLLAFVWAYFRLPEFKGRTFREIDILFSRKVSARRFKDTPIGVYEEAKGDIEQIE